MEFYVYWCFKKACTSIKQSSCLRAGTWEGIVALLSMPLVQVCPRMQSCSRIEVFCCRYGTGENPQEVLLQVANISAKVDKRWDLQIKKTFFEDGVLEFWIGTYLQFFLPVDGQAPLFSVEVKFCLPAVRTNPIKTAAVPWSGRCNLQHPKYCLSNVCRPTIPEDAPPLLAEIMQECWNKNPLRRPTFLEISERLGKIDSRSEIADALRAKVYFQSLEFPKL